MKYFHRDFQETQMIISLVVLEFAVFAINTN